MNLTQPTTQPWLDDPAAYWGSLSAATEGLDTPFGAISVPALAWNAHDMLRRANGTTIRVASKSVRVRGAIDAVLKLPGYHGVLAYTLPEALWLADTIEDVVVGYPTAHRAAIRALGTSAKLSKRVTLMIDSVEHLDLIDAAIGAGKRETIRVAIDLDASYDTRTLGFIGVRRSPIRTPEQAVALGQAIVARAGFSLVGMMAYEAQVAGVVNRPKGKPLLARTVDFMQGRSTVELHERRGAVAAGLRQLADLEFVNGGGTGSLERTSSDASVTEIAAGSGLFGPHLFDGYSHFHPAPAAAFALSVVRKPTPSMATLLGGGWIASGPSAPDRTPELAWPAGLKFIAREGAGEVQSPLDGPGAAGLELGDRVWLRHTKAGELSEHLTEFAMVEDGKIVDTLPTYRGEGKAWL